MTNKKQPRTWEHLKPGRAYIISNSYGGTATFFIGNPHISNSFNAYRNLQISSGSIAVYIKTIFTNHHVYHQIVYNGVVGLVNASYVRLKRITLRSIRRSYLTSPSSLPGNLPPTEEG